MICSHRISAVRASLDQVGKVILEHHIEHCVTEAVGHGKAKEAINSIIINHCTFRSIYTKISLIDKGKQSSLFQGEPYAG
ncbi:metal-sensitive transcriptional regulator [Tengunoibacter tsumagoiensis]|uniref:Metal-sensitive transcriptional repressor n=1 Tax=Tengunoibacter tsumagoiensis TaxID=2014871 RepID=A0A402A8L3_9CHLR|nr:hypothetical protein KTT_53590 [Tengunoibacter tsumagoiensis]